MASFSNVNCWAETCPTCRVLWARPSYTSSSSSSLVGRQIPRRRCRKVDPVWLKKATTKSSDSTADSPCVLAKCLWECSKLLSPRLPWYFITEPSSGKQTMKMYLTDHEERVELYTPIGTPQMGLMQQLPDLNVTKAMHLARSQMEGCIRNHGSSCNHRFHEYHSLSDDPLPARLLEIVDSGTRVRLIDLDPNSEEAEASCDGGVRYAALSYVWGRFDPNRPFVRTTAETKETAKTQGLAVTELPRTLSDAVAMTSLLGLKYIWIDALCIIQGCAADWGRESSKMASVYGRAFVTLIAAACDSCHDPLIPGATNPTKDLQEEKRKTEIKQCEASTVAKVEIDYEDGEIAHVRIRKASRVGSHAVKEPTWTGLETQPIQRRAWCMQEEFLSSRYIKFLPGDLQWACRLTMGCQCMGTGEEESGGGESGGRQQEQNQISPNASKQQPRDLLDIEASVGSDPQGAWAQLIEDYSQRLLTNEQDRLPAMAGLASHFAEHMHGVHTPLASYPTSSLPPSYYSTSPSSLSSSPCSSKSSLFSSSQHTSPALPPPARYLAGIWVGGRSSLAIQLGWRRLTEEEEVGDGSDIDGSDHNIVSPPPSIRVVKRGYYPISYVAPSFSWASVTSPVSYEFLKEQQDQLNRMDQSLGGGGPREYVEEMLSYSPLSEGHLSSNNTTATTYTIQATSDPFGRVCAGQLNLRVPLLRGKLVLAQAITLPSSCSSSSCFPNTLEISPGKVKLQSIWPKNNHYVWFVPDGPLCASLTPGQQRWTASRLGASAAAAPCIPFSAFSSSSSFSTSSNPLEKSTIIADETATEEEGKKTREEDTENMENKYFLGEAGEEEEGENPGMMELGMETNNSTPSSSPSSSPPPPPRTTTTITNVDIQLALLGDTFRPTGIQDGDLAGAIVGILLGDSGSGPGSGSACRGLERLGYCHIHIRPREADAWIRGKGWEGYMRDNVVII